jgi:hypothetical protein
MKPAARIALGLAFVMATAGAADAWRRRLGLVAVPRWPVPVVMRSVALMAGFMAAGMAAPITVGGMGAHIMAADGDTAPRSMAPGP